MTLSGFIVQLDKLVIRVFLFNRVLRFIGATGFIQVIRVTKTASLPSTRKNEAASQPQEAYVHKKLDDLKGANNAQPNNNENNVPASNNAHPKQENGLFPFNNNSTSLHLITGILVFSYHFMISF